MNCLSASVRVDSLPFSNPIMHPHKDPTMDTGKTVYDFVVKARKGATLALAPCIEALLA